MTIRETLAPLLRIFAIVGLVSGVAVLGYAAPGKRTPAESQSPIAGAFDAECTAALKRLESQVDQIVQVQQTTLATYNEILEELRAVKVRVSR